ncbi:MAG: hypothetical protein RQ723_05550 [Desulfuromonadales bacterium]|nr:hypothetical protein [Desulfuromonadales bacterium]
MELILWGAFVVGACLVARDKNRHIIGWGLLGLLLGPFALLILALLPPGPGPDQGYQ